MPDHIRLAGNLRGGSGEDISRRLSARTDKQVALGCCRSTELHEDVSTRVQDVAVFGAARLCAK